MKKSVRKELSFMVYRFENDPESAKRVFDTARKMGIVVEARDHFKTEPGIHTVTLAFDPDSMQTPILQHNVRVFLSEYGYALQVKKVSWWKRIFNFFK